MPAPKGNKYAVGNKGGRPRKFDNPDEIYQAGLKYIEDKLSKDEHLTFTGLCIALGVVKDTFNDYESGKYDEDNKVFSVPLKDLKQRVENYAETKLFGNNPTGAIFALKNYGWKDKQEIEQKTDGTIEIVFNSQLDAWSK
jgi:hypothetical protein